MAVDSLNGAIIGDGGMTGGDANELSIFLVSVVDDDKTVTATSLQEQPEIGEGGQTGGGDIAEVSAL